jgi:hypothetical protein
MVDLDTGGWSAAGCGPRETSGSPATDDVPLPSATRCCGRWKASLTADALRILDQETQLAEPPPQPFPLGDGFVAAPGALKRSPLGTDETWFDKELNRRKIPFTHLTW